MKVKIVECSDNTFTYKNDVGKTVEAKDGGQWWWNSSEISGSILKSDCEIVEPVDEPKEFLCRSNIGGRCNIDNQICIDPELCKTTGIPVNVVEPKESLPWHDAKVRESRLYKELETDYNTVVMQWKQRGIENEALQKQLLQIKEAFDICDMQRATCKNERADAIAKVKDLEKQLAEVKAINCEEHRLANEMERDKDEEIAALNIALSCQKERLEDSEKQCEDMFDDIQALQKLMVFIGKKL